ncbi:MAG: hypothetical protein WC802_02270 [Patescibacteria group bacterium]|jgi:hypothetical protein
MDNLSTATQTQTQTKTSTKIGIGIVALAGLAAAAGFLIASRNTLPVLVIKALPNPASHSTVAGSFEQVLSFSLLAQNKPVTVNRLMFTATADTDGTFSSIENNINAGDHLSSCVLNNAQGALVGQGQIPDNQGNISFTNLAQTIPANVTRTFRLWCTFANVPTDGANADIYAFSIKTDASVDAHTDRGAILPGNRINIGGPNDPGVNFPPNIAVTVRDGGTLSAGPYSTPGTGIALAGTPLVNTVSYAFSATNEPFIIQTLTLKNTGDDTAVQTVKIKYLDQLGAQVVKTATLSNHLAKFTGLNAYVPAGASNKAVIDVAVDTAPITATGSARSGMIFGLDLDFTTANGFKAVAQTSGHTVTESSMGASIHADTLTLRKTRPYLSLSSASPSGASVPGRSEVLRFNIWTAPGGPVALQQIMFRLMSTSNEARGWNACSNFGGDANRWQIRDFSTGTALGDASNWRILSADGTACNASNPGIATYAIVTFNQATGGLLAIPTSSSGAKALSVWFDSTGASSSQDDTIRLEIVDELTANATNNDSIRWTDADTGVTNIDGQYITSPSIVGGTLVY